MKMGGRLRALIDLIPMIWTSSAALDDCLRAYFRPRRYAGSSDRRWIGDHFFHIVRNFAVLRRVVQSFDEQRETPWNAQRILISFLKIKEEKETEAIRELFAVGAPYLDPLTTEDCLFLDFLDKTEWRHHITTADVWNLSGDLWHALNQSIGFEGLEEDRGGQGRAPHNVENLNPSEGGHDGDKSNRVRATLEPLTLPAPVDLRVNTLKTNREAVLQRLRNDGIGAVFCPHTPYGIRLTDRSNITNHPLFLEGHVDIQDEGSQLLAMVAQARPGEIWLDYCAGAGGKALLLAQVMENQGTIYATDHAPERLAPIAARIQRAQCTNIYPIDFDGQELRHLQHKCQGVFVDAPCSGTGTLRRHPEIGLRFTRKQLDHYGALQRDILDQAAQYVAPGGRLIYGTCSLLHQENDDQIQSFVQRHGDFTITSVPNHFPGQSGVFFRALPHLLGTDGFFGAILTRRP